MTKYGYRRGGTPFCGTAAENCVDPGFSYAEALPLAIATVPVQAWVQTLDACDGLKHGTIFPELVLPFLGRREACVRR